MIYSVIFFFYYCDYFHISRIFFYLLGKSFFFYYISACFKLLTFSFTLSALFFVCGCGTIFAHIIIIIIYHNSFYSVHFFLLYQAQVRLFISSTFTCLYIFIFFGGGMLIIFFFPILFLHRTLIHSLVCLAWTSRPDRKPKKEYKWQQ